MIVFLKCFKRGKFGGISKGAQTCKKALYRVKRELCPPMFKVIELPCPPRFFGEANKKHFTIGHTWSMIVNCTWLVLISNIPRLYLSINLKQNVVSLVAVTLASYIGYLELSVEVLGFPLKLITRIFSAVPFGMRIANNITTKIIVTFECEAVLCFSSPLVTLT